MTDKSLTHVQPFLSEISERDRVWDLKRRQTAQIAELYKGTRLDRLYERMNHCADSLRFKLTHNDLEVSLKLDSARFCRVRHCTICQWRRVRMWFGRFVNTLPKILEDYPSARFLHLTLTVRNCDVKELKKTLAFMNQSWSRFSRRKEFKAILGWVKTVEFTRNEDKDSAWYGSVHPHFHALLMVKPSYFKKHYVSHENWIKAWREALRVDYDPSVRVQTIKPKNKPPSSATPPLPSMPVNGVPMSIDDNGFPIPLPDSSLPAPTKALPHEMVSALAEVIKYTVKPQDLVIGGEWLLELTEQLRGTKAIAVGGIMRQYLKEDEPDDEEMINAGLEDETDEAISDLGNIAFGWRERAMRYRQMEA